MKKLSYILFIGLLLSACSKFGDTNVDPTRLKNAPTRAFLTNALQDFSQTATSINSANYYVQYVAEGPYPGNSLYAGKNFDFGTFYSSPLYNLQQIIQYNTDEATKNTNAQPAENGSNVNQIAVARILKAYIFWWLTDRYGNIPYKNALKGNGNFYPDYTPQEEIYTDIFKELKEAAAQIKVDESGVKGDIMLNGNMTLWKKFANTTRLMMALRLVKKDFERGKTEFNAALTDGLLSSNADNIVYKFLDDPKNYNPWYINYSVSQRNDYAITTTLTDYMQAKNDPRLFVYAETLSGGVVKGLPYGLSIIRNISQVYSRLGNAFRSAASPAYVQTYAQVLFTLAEGAKIGYIPGGDATAALHYANAIRASWEQYGVYNATALATYMALPDIVYDPANGLKKIMSEKWVHLYLNGYEAWADWRRTGFPVLTPAKDAVDPRGIPRRQGYPSAEASLNKANYDKAVQAQGEDNNYTRIWWDKI